MIRPSPSQLGRLFDQWFSTLVSVTLHAGVLCVSASYWSQPPTVGAMESGSGGDGGTSTLSLPNGDAPAPSAGPVAVAPDAGLPAAAAPWSPPRGAPDVTADAVESPADASVAGPSFPPPPWAASAADLVPAEPPAYELIGVAATAPFPRGRALPPVYPSTRPADGADAGNAVASASGSTGSPGLQGSNAAVERGTRTSLGPARAGDTGPIAGGAGESGGFGAGGSGTAGSRAAGVAFGVNGRGAAGPVYPPDSLRAGEEGTALVAVSLSETGLPASTRVEVSSGFPRLDRRALDWVRRSASFTPALEAGRAVRSELKIPVRFVLRQPP